MSRGGNILKIDGVTVSDPCPGYEEATQSLVRTIVPFIETAMSDREAWEALLDDKTRLSILRSYPKCGCWKGKRPKCDAKPQPQGALAL